MNMDAKCSGSTSVSKTDRSGSIPDASANNHREEITPVCKHDVSQDCPACMQEEIDRLRVIEKAARDYYLGYVQDEAAEWEGCISEIQHEHAKALRDALGEK
jgi:hypothetical protein